MDKEKPGRLKGPGMEGLNLLRVNQLHVVMKRLVRDHG